MNTNTNVAKIERLHHIAIVTLQERMDVLNAPALMKVFAQLLEEHITHFVIDLSGVRVVDADGDYPLLHLLKCVQEVDGVVSLVCPIGNPIRVFYEMMRLDTLFEIFDTLDSALAQQELLSPLSKIQDSLCF
ncbi:MAG: STAS domain-containing protein [Anaerolineae bacterium]|nr:STAS domain-containing protein [Anaerolineae bacterium]